MNLVEAALRVAGLWCTTQGVPDPSATTPHDIVFSLLSGAYSTFVDAPCHGR